MFDIVWCKWVQSGFSIVVHHHPFPFFSLFVCYLDLKTFFYYFLLGNNISPAAILQSFHSLTKVITMVENGFYTKTHIRTILKGEKTVKEIYMWFSFLEPLQIPKIQIFDMWKFRNFVRGIFHVMEFEYGFRIFEMDSIFAGVSFTKMINCH